MNRHYLTAAIIAVSTMTVSACTTQNANQTAVLNNNSIDKNEASKLTTVKNTTVKDAHHPKWSYSGDVGPESWGDVEGANICKTGQAQSPINISRVTTKTSAATAPMINYRQLSSIRIHDNGHTVVYTPTTEDNSIRLNNDTYVLKQFHYHTPSEHQFGGQSYPGEIHFVHANSQGNLAVIGVMLDIGNSSEALRPLIEGTLRTTQNDDEVITAMNLSALAPSAATFYHYTGSLTTPPCSEQVQWYVSKQPLTLASTQFAVLSDLYDGNNRPIQSQGSRTVQQLSH